MGGGGGGAIQGTFSSFYYFKRWDQYLFLSVQTKSRVPTGQGKVREICFFLQGQGKVKEFCKMVREIGKSEKVREKSGNLRINFRFITVKWINRYKKMIMTELRRCVSCKESHADVAWYIYVCNYYVARQESMMLINHPFLSSKII